MQDDNELGILNAEKARFPVCITWTPLPLISWLIPSIGHVGIGHSNGMIHDFAGPYYIGIDDFAFGETTKYVKLKIDESDIARYNKSLERADKEYKKRVHNLCCDNCHSHVARVLNNYKYNGKENWNMVSVWWLSITHSRYVSWCALIKTYIGWFIIMILVVTVAILSQDDKK